MFARCMRLFSASSESFLKMSEADFEFIVVFWETDLGLVIDFSISSSSRFFSSLIFSIFIAEHSSFYFILLRNLLNLFSVICF